jgi:hypothetical protein
MDVQVPLRMHCSPVPPPVTPPAVAPLGDRLHTCSSSSSSSSSSILVVCWSHGLSFAKNQDQRCALQAECCWLPLMPSDLLAVSTAVSTAALTQQAPGHCAWN